MNCVWCHNPESIEAKPQLSFSSQRCIGCGACFNVCSNRVHILEHGSRVIHWKLCEACGNCTSVCPTGALEIIGWEMAVDEIIEEVIKDIPFYSISGGGITISGGEPMMQPKFTLEILRAAKKNGLDTTLDTCGYFDWERFKETILFLDLVFFDLKQMDSKIHKELTGRDNTVILDNLRRLASEAIPIIIRVPVIPGYTDTETNFHQMGSFLKSLNHCPDVELLPYHVLAGSKYSRFGFDYKLKNLSPPNSKSLKKIAEILSSYGINVKIR